MAGPIGRGSQRILKYHYPTSFIVPRLATRRIFVASRTFLGFPRIQLLSNLQAEHQPLHAALRHRRAHYLIRVQRRLQQQRPLLL